MHRITFIVILCEQKLNLQGSAAEYRDDSGVIEIHLEDGTRVERAAEVYRGGPERPFKREELHGKFRECAEVVLPEERIGAALDELEGVAELMDVLAGPGRRGGEGRRGADRPLRGGPPRSA